MPSDRLLKPPRIHLRLMAWAQSLRSKILLSHLAGILIAAIIVSFSLLTLAETYFLNALESSLISQAYVITQSLFPRLQIEPPETQFEPAFNTVQQQVTGNLNIQVVSPSDPPQNQASSLFSRVDLNSLRDITLELSSSIETRFILIDRDGATVLASTDLDLEPFKDIPAAQDAFAGRVSSNVEKIKGEDWLFIATPLLQDDETAAILLLGHPLRDITAVLRDLRTRLFLAIGIAVPLATLLAFSLSRNLLRPINVLSEATLGMQHGDFESPISIERSDELGQLTWAFDNMRRRLLEIEKLRTQFISDVSHELRTPLTAIKGLTESLQDGAVNDPEVRDRFLDSIERETDRLIRMTNDLLTLTRADAGGMTLKYEILDLRRLIQDTKTKLSPDAGRRKITIHLELPRSPILVSADRDRLDQVLTNVLDNALKHSPAEGEIKVIVCETHNDPMQAGAAGKVVLEPRQDDAQQHRQPRHVVIYVQDWGTGVSAEDLPHVFERFYRADYARSRDIGGSGLGLAIAHALMEAHGGQIQLLSPSPGWDGVGNPGTTVVLTLPAAVTPP